MVTNWARGSPGFRVATTGRQARITWVTGEKSFTAISLQKWGRSIHTHVKKRNGGKGSCTRPTTYWKPVEGTVQRTQRRNLHANQHLELFLRCWVFPNFDLKQFQVKNRCATLEKLRKMETFPLKWRVCTFPAFPCVFSRNAQYFQPAPTHTHISTHGPVLLHIVAYCYMCTCIRSWAWGSRHCKDV